MKEKFTKPKVNIMMNILVGGDKNDPNNHFFALGDNDQINGSKVEGENEDW